MCVPAFVLLIAIRGLRPGHPQSDWLLSPSVVFHGLPLIVTNVLIYSYVCWLDSGSFEAQQG